MIIPASPPDSTGRVDPCPAPARRSTARYVLGILGPGLVTGAADDDPSGIATYSQTGAQFGYGQLWTALWMLPLVTGVQEACGRIGNITGQGLAANIERRYSKGTLWLLLALLAAANTINIGADVGAIGAGAALPEIPGDPLALERQVCFALSVAARSVLSIYRPILEPMGLTHPQYLVMLALWGQSPLAVKELIEMLQLDGPTLSPMLKRLEAAGLVTRTRDPHDERQLRVDLTEKGRALRRQALNVPPTVVAKLGMSLGDLEELHRGLTTLNDAARRAGVKPVPGPAKDSI